LQFCCIFWVFRIKISPERQNIRTGVYRAYFSPPQAIAVRWFKICHENLLPHSFQFIMHQSTCYTTKYNLRNIKRSKLGLYNENNFFMARLLAGQGLPIFEAWRSGSVRHTKVGRIPLDEWSTRSKDLYLTSHSTHKRQTLLPPAGFELTFPTNERPQTHALDLAITGIGKAEPHTHKYTIFCISLLTYCRMYKQSYISVVFSEAYVHYTLPSSAEVKRQWNSTCTPPVCL